MGFSFSASRKRNGDPIKASNEARAKANLEVGKAIAAQAKLFAPVDYGQLRNSISAANLKTSVLLNINPGKRGNPLSTQGLKGDEVYVGANVEHAAPQEYGTNKTHAQPYLRPAADVVTGGATAAEIIKKLGRESMDRELKR